MFAPAVERAGCQATARRQRVDGFSGQRAATEAMLNGSAPAFLGLLINLPELAGRPICSCAEPHAVAQLVQQFGGGVLPDIRVRRTLYSGGYEILRPCANCSQWLVEDGTDVYKIAPAFLPAVQRADYSHDATGFPALGAKKP